MKTNNYKIGTNVEWLDCESNVPFYTIINSNIKDDGQTIYYIRHRIQPYAYWVLESRIRLSQKVNRFNRDLDTDPRLKINAKIGYIPVPLDTKTELQKAWIEMRHAVVTIVAVICIGILQSLNLR